MSLTWMTMSQSSILMNCGKTFLWKREADDLTYRAKVVAQLNDKDAQDHQ